MCVIPTHLFGVPADIAKVRGLCNCREIFVIEDAAQAMGAVSDRGKLGTFGDAAFFSLGRGKNITCGSGGIIITSAEDIAESIREDYVNLEKVPVVEYAKNMLEIVAMMVFLRPEFYWLPKKLPFLKIGETRFYRTFPVRNLSGFQAGLLHDWRQKLETLNRCRSDNADGYIERLELPNGMHIHAKGIPYNRFPIYLEGKASKGELCESGNRLGISPMYPFPVNRIQEIREDLDHGGFEGAETISDTLVTLPTHILLNEDDKTMILGVVNKALRHVRKSEPAFRQGVGCH
jgi:dTDP-4-amino-4,6-dideoxygalactose transaminase